MYPFPTFEILLPFKESITLLIKFSVSLLKYCDVEILSSSNSLFICGITFSSKYFLISSFFTPSLPISDICKIMMIHSQELYYVLELGGIPVILLIDGIKPIPV